MGAPEEDPGYEREDDFRLSADHPLLQRAQKALKEQLVETKLRLEAELKEQCKALDDAKVKREDLGVELFGFQQQVNGILQSLDESDKRQTQLDTLSRTADARLLHLQQQAAAQHALSQQRFAQVESQQDEVNKLANMVRQMETFHEEMRSKVAVTKRETYASEEALQRQEKEKLAQDSLITHLTREIQGQTHKLARLQERHDFHTSRSDHLHQVIVETSASAAAVQEDMSVLVGRWKDALLGLQKRDSTLQKIQEASQKLSEEVRSLDLQIASALRDTAAVASSRQKMNELLSRVQGAAVGLASQVKAQAEQYSAVQADQAALQARLEQTQAQLAEAKLADKALQEQNQQATRAAKKVTDSLQAGKAQELALLEEGTLAERGAQQTAQEVKRLQAAAAAEEANASLINTEPQTLQAQSKAINVRNEQLTAGLGVMDADLARMAGRIGEAESSARQRADSIERYTRHMDAVNRGVEKAIAARGPELHNGPLEATIAHLRLELGGTREGTRGLQRRWIVAQREHLSLQASNSSAAAALQRMHSQAAVLAQRKIRLLRQQEVSERELKQLHKTQEQQHVLVSHFDAQIAAHNSTEEALASAALTFQTRAISKLKELEADALTLKAQIQASRDEKAAYMHKLLDTERQVMDWERTVQLDNEMYTSLSPGKRTGDANATARRELHRLQLQATELGCHRDRLLQELELAVSKRDTIAVKGRAAVQRHAPNASAQAEAAGRLRIANELQKALRRTAAKTAACQSRIEELETADPIEGEEAELRQACEQLASQISSSNMAVEIARRGKIEALLQTSSLHRSERLHQKAAEGTYKLLCNPEEVEAELAKALQKRAAILDFIQQADADGELKGAMEHLSLKCSADVTL